MGGGGRRVRGRLVPSRLGRVLFSLCRNDCRLGLRYLGVELHLRDIRFTSQLVNRSG